MRTPIALAITTAALLAAGTVVAQAHQPDPWAGCERTERTFRVADAPDGSLRTLTIVTRTCPDGRELVVRRLATLPDGTGPSGPEPSWRSR